MIVEKLFWQKYRPKSIEAMILLPRIRQQITKDDDLVINGNLLFTGIQGTGKTSLANILSGKGAKKINASYNSSVDDLREEVMDYCRQVSDNIFDEDYDQSAKQFKIVYLDEFDGVSSKYQEALRGFIEEHSDRVRFIATCNNLTKISPAMQSRFNVINFDPQTASEQKELKEMYLERLEMITEKNDLKLDKQELSAIINVSFPDLRSAINKLQEISVSGKKEGLSVNIYEQFYKFVFSKSKPDETYNWVIENFGDKVDQVFKMLGRPLAEHIIQYKTEHINKLPNLVPLVTRYSSQLSNCIDPVVLILACIYDVQGVINSNK